MHELAFALRQSKGCGTTSGIFTACVLHQGNAFFSERLNDSPRAKAQCSEAHQRRNGHASCHDDVGVQGLKQPRLAQRSDLARKPTIELAKDFRLPSAKHLSAVRSQCQAALACQQRSASPIDCLCRFAKSETKGETRIMTEDDGEY